MKTITLKNTYHSLMCGLLIACAGISCQKSALQNSGTGSTAIDGLSKSSGGSTSLQALALRVTVSNADLNNIPYKITNDNNGDYVNGLQNVSANFDQYGNFIFNCGAASNTPGSPLTRWLNFNFDSPIAVYINPPITSGSNIGNAMTSVPATGFTYTPLQSMAVGQVECISLTGGPSYKNSPAWTANFHRGAEDVSSSPSAYAVVTRISSTQWTMTPVGTCSPNSNVAALRNGPGTLYGYYNLPFYFTLTVK